ncbi:hypothetical protein BRC2024_KCUCJSVR_CDS_0035 [Acinetobacter phage vB_AbaM_KissB]
MKMSTQEIIDFLSVNQSAWKKVALKNIEDISAVNDELEEKDIYTLKHDCTFYDALNDHNTPFEDVLNDFFMLHLDIEQNSNDVMIWLQRIYA